MRFHRFISLIRHGKAFVFATVLTAGLAGAQSTASHAVTDLQDGSSIESSSLQPVPLAGADVLEVLHSAPIAGKIDAGQNGGEHDRFYSLSHIAIEAGAGFNAPIGNDTPYITWGGNVTGGVGLHLSQRFSVLGEFQFMDNKLPGAFIASGGGQGGNAHIFSLTVDPVVDLFPKRANSVFLTGGGGFYHKSTNFTVQECCDFNGYPVNVTTNGFSSNQGGLNIGLGFTHRLGGVYGDGQVKLFGEARYVYIHTPLITETNGLGTTELIPVTFGVRW